MVPAILIIGAGYFLGGVLGDLAYNKFKIGRLDVSLAGIVLGALFLTITLATPLEKVFAFRIPLSITYFLIPQASPNIATSVYDVVLPEVCSTATSIQYFLGNLGSAFAPLPAGAISEISSLEIVLLTISLSAWLITAVILMVGIINFRHAMSMILAALEVRAAERFN